MADNPRLAALKAKLIEECERLLDKPGAMLRREAVFDDQADKLYDQLMDADDIVDDPDAAATDFRSELSRRFAPAPPARQNKPPVSSTARPASGSGRPREPVPLHLLTSPYRFVELNDKVVMAEPPSPLFQPLPGGFTGRISVEWAVESPMLIGSEKDGLSRPLRLPDGRYAIPGATLRGMVRASAEIVAGARLSQINGHHRYGLRDFTHPRVRPPENEKDSLLDADKLKAGWLRYKEISGGKPEIHITPCSTWRRIAHDDLRDLLKLPAEKDKYHWRAKWLKRPMVDRYRAAGFEILGGRTPYIDFDKAPVLMFNRTGTKPRDGFAKPNAVGNPGRLVFSNKSPAPPLAADIKEKEDRRGEGQPKKNEYVFFDDPAAKDFKVDAKAWDRFWLINTKPARRRREPDGSLAVLWPTLKAGGKVPVFYVQEKDGNPETLQLGLTRFFKIAHEHSVRDLLDKERGQPHKQPAAPAAFKPDLVESLFGHVLEADDFTPAAPKGQSVARKGRVAFGFAYLENAGDAEETGTIRTVMGAPRASFAPFYLAGRIKDYSHPEARLAGRKRYVPRFRPQDLASAPKRLVASLTHQVSRLGRNAEQLNEIGSDLRLLRHKRDGEKMIFRSDIRVRNVTAVELGLLLWVLTHGGDPAKPYRHQIGRAKPFGAGQVLVRGLRLSLQPHDLADRSLLQPPDAAERAGASGEGWTDGTLSLRPFLKAFETFMAQHWTNWPHVRPVTQWLRSCRPDWGAEQVGQRPEPEGRFTYPDLKEFNTIRKAVKMDNKQPAPHPDNPASLLAVPSE
ncbi:hypothetical protein [Niveispirillum irakense]|uniref:hypothetical protein n=1 Tax=Niveispirillum irakense TaxID=34011 RepID=UPI000428BD3A|nr:hypothetical protein [Niveispirillum irakense]